LDKYIQSGGIFVTPKKKRFYELMKKIDGLPEFKQAAVQWTLCHWNLVKELCEHENNLSPEDIEKEIQKAVEEKDYVYYALLVYLKVISKEKENL